MEKRKQHHTTTARRQRHHHLKGKRTKQHRVGNQHHQTCEKSFTTPQEGALVGFLVVCPSLVSGHSSHVSGASSSSFNCEWSPLSSVRPSSFALWGVLLSLLVAIPLWVASLAVALPSPSKPPLTASLPLHHCGSQSLKKRVGRCNGYP